MNLKSNSVLSFPRLTFE
jgi:hypothetical protein